MKNKFDYNEIIVFIVRKTGWTLEYVRALSLKDLQLFVEELNHQEEIADYVMRYNFAICLANWANSQGRKKYRPEQFIGGMPQRKIEEVDIWRLAKKAGIRMPAKRA